MASKFSEKQTLYLRNLLAMLRALHLSHHSAHLQASGPQSYQDHLLYGRLYEGLVDEADGLAEKLVAMCGADTVDAADQAKRIAEIVAKGKSHSDLAKRAYMMEEAFVAMIEAVRKAMLNDDALPSGLDNYLQGLADKHEGACYLLKQRLGLKDAS